ncbi:uncharacterized protein LOC117345256 [Pecten maximus]|uniref:uncharacterized protein LOC117345256 n=1 Tax=Pecten maximus TaxID=6579 RepID=UPI00145917C7|nr:uncharacterized protein LOC117345256 [Pecten maximus]
MTGLSVLVLFCLMVSCIQETSGQAALYSPPGRSAMWAYLGNAAYASKLTPNFDYTTNLNCGGNIVTPTTYETSCGPCGDAIDPGNPTAVRSNEAPGGEFAIGEVVWYYHEGATINVTLDVRAPLAGGFYQFALCKTDDSTIVTHDCFSHKLTWANTGQMTIPAPTYSGYATYTLQLPVGLTCDNCVLQWKWIDGAYSCQMLDMLVCGPTVTNCADIAIVPQGTDFPHHFDWPRYDEYASIFSADGNPGTLPHHTTPVTGLTTASLQDTTTTATIAPTIVTTTANTIATPTTTQSTPTMTTPTSTQTMPTTTQTTPTATQTTPRQQESTTPRTPIIIIFTTPRPDSGSTTREPEPTNAPATSTVSTTTPSQTTPQAARLVQPVAAAAVVPGVLGVTSVLSGQTGLGIVFLLLALFASQIKTHLQPFGGAPSSGYSLPRAYPVFSPGYTGPLPSLQWYGRPYTGLNNQYTRFGTVQPQLASYPYGRSNFNSRYVPNGSPGRYIGNTNNGINNVGNSRYHPNGYPGRYIGNDNTGFNTGGNGRYPPNGHPGRYNGNGNNRYSPNGYPNRKSGYGNKGVVKGYNNNGYRNNMNNNKQWNSNQQNSNNGYVNNQGQITQGYTKSGYGNSAQNNWNRNPNGQSLSNGMIAEYDNDPAPSVVKTPDSGACLCRGRLEVFTVYCMNYGDNREGCEKEGDVCYCKV